MDERKWIERYTLKVDSSWDFPNGPVVKTSSSNAGGVDSIPDQGVKISHEKKKKPKQKKYCNRFNKDLKKSG